MYKDVKYYAETHKQQDPQLIMFYANIAEFIYQNDKDPVCIEIFGF
jgi:hypothetical protein